MERCDEMRFISWNIDSLNAALTGSSARAELSRALLDSLGATVVQLDGCCGLAGNFGMEKGHYDMSVEVARTSLLPALNAYPDAVYLADGFSCRTQAQQLADRGGMHLASLLASQI